jgi:hypothetical protein
MDYVWGQPAQAFLTAMTRRELPLSDLRLALTSWESASPTIALPAAVLRGMAVTILGTAGIPRPRFWSKPFQQVMAYDTKGDLIYRHRKGTARRYRERLAAGPPGRRLVIIP